jgi:hypothetical protein
MTHDSTHLGSLSSLPSPVSIKTADDTPLLVVSHDTLRTTYFHVLSVSHVPQLHLQLFSVGQITDHGCCVILDSVFFLFMMVALGPWLALAAGSVTPLISRSLTDYIFLQFPLHVGRLLLLMPLLFSSLPLPAFLGIII